MAASQSALRALMRRTAGDRPAVAGPSPTLLHEVGGAWLAAVSVQEREAALQAFAAEHPDVWPQAREHVEQALSDYRKHGFVFNLGRSHPDINAIGVPVVSPDGRTVMALTCGGVRTRMSKDKLTNQVAPELKRLAQQIAPALGGEGARR